MYVPPSRQRPPGFEEIVESTLCPYAQTAVVRVLPPLGDEPIDTYFRRIAPEIRRRVSSAEADGTDAVLTELPVERVGSRPQELAPVLGAWIREIADEGSECLPDTVPARWRLKVAGSDVFVAVFTPDFGRRHARYTPDTRHVYVMLQPDSSFHRRLPEDSGRVRRSIRRRFARAGRDYDTTCPEAERFLPPCGGEEPTAWWEYSMKEVYR
ncbi:YqcI/YcgG family protein [Streptomyces sp. NBC_00249]|uniref:YqcI/YcgG family protein n=1 Tax=Streptomyces sp. NBC_00249 TaxID=2975690 RepID=UPI00225536C7|nr:YqcI/YcgG family protein [Streptomyces sp. NBC_00249]MCX5195074.1 YqcI/YcgG family protein [Streptomyces sp. NBC_00249]